MKPATLAYLKSNLLHLEQKMRKAVTDRAAMLAKLDPNQRMSAENLLHYLTLRNEDIRDLQDGLHSQGLSSLASSESHILRQIQSVLLLLGENIPANQLAECSPSIGKRTIQHHSNLLFGHKTNPAIPHIMVTFDTDFADNERKVHQLLLAGMNVARINCAHDGPEIWLAMIENIKRCSAKSGLPCKIYMDLAGPKIRTQILGKGHKKGRADFSDQRMFYLAEPSAAIDTEQIVVGCTLPGIIGQLKAGDRVLFDDGLFEARVEQVKKGMARLQMLRISAEKPRLKAEKGINFPDTSLSLESLTDDDRAVLPFALEHADLIGYSFVRTPADLQVLQENLQKIPTTRPLPSIIIKIETPDAVKNLPNLLLQGMTQAGFGVMIARGDLAVEIGFERMSEIQEEILWICEAAHVPVIWATQVLENLNKSGIATRSEVTDAAHAAMAECVMINKGGFTLRVVETLKDILQRSGGHHFKKTYSMRSLGIAGRFLAN
ncbi:MAG: pyruvate kinase [Bacteroidetes bacterium]|nr:pyruvate kinase [Bacteroidota bacterium]